MTTRLIGAIIMVHGDNSGLKLPPRVAPTQVMIIPIQQQKDGVLEAASKLEAEIKKAGIRVKTDVSDKSPGWKFSEQEMRGIPVRIEIGPKDIEAGHCVACRRDNGEKQTIALEEAASKLPALLEQIQQDMFEAARVHREEHTYTAVTMEEFEKCFTEKTGFVKAMWCGEQECEDIIKEKLAVTSRCMPFDGEKLADTCVCCGKPAKKMVYRGKAY